MFRCLSILLLVCSSLLAELRCQTGRFRVAVGPDMDFEVPDGAGECNLVIKADAQMDFEFLQF